jgi:hypothetical protein
VRPTEFFDAAGASVLVWAPTGRGGDGGDPAAFFSKLDADAAGRAIVDVAPVFPQYRLLLLPPVALSGQRELERLGEGGFSREIGIPATATLLPIMAVNQGKQERT